MLKIRNTFFTAKFLPSLWHRERLRRNTFLPAQTMILPEDKERKSFRRSERMDICIGPSR
jgi:hypothetical protein